MIWTGARVARGAALAIVTTIGTVVAPCHADAATYRWNQNVATGVWNSANNWTRTDAPGGGFPIAGDTASFPGPYSFPAPTGNAVTVTIPANQTVTVGNIVCATNVNLTIAAEPGGRLVLDNGPDPNVQLQSNVAAAVITLNTPVELHGAVTVHVVASGSVTFSRSVTEDSQRSLTKTGPGLLTFAAVNEFTGETAVHEGLLVLQSQSVPSVAGPLSIGDGAGNALSARVLTLFPDQIADSSNVTVNADGVFDVSRSERVNELILRDGLVVVAAPALSMQRLSMVGGELSLANTGFARLEGSVTATSSARGPALISRASAAARLDLLDATRTFTVEDGQMPTDLEIAAPIGGTGTAGLIKEGAGTLRFSGPAANTYPGETVVRQGRLDLARDNALAVPRDLHVGGGAGPAVVSPLRLQNIGASATITVGADGLLSCGGGIILEIARLFVNTSGRVEIGMATAASTVTVVDAGSMAMTGGQIAIKQDGRLSVRGGLAATSTPFQSAAIDGEGVLQFSSMEGVVAALDGPQPIDLRIGARIAGVNLTLDSAGVTQFAGLNSYAGVTSITGGGTLLVTGTQPASAISLTRGAIGGTGTVGAITAGTAQPTRIAPGLSPGQLTSGSLTLAASTTFAVELTGATAGAGYDQLVALGTVNLGNAVLTGTRSISAAPFAQFIIIDNDGTDAVAGTFAGLAEGSAVSINGQTFTISYAGGSGNDVVLTATADMPPPPPPPPLPLPPPTALTYFLAEGATGTFFDEDVLIANPNGVDAAVTLTFLREGGATIVQQRTVPALSRLTIRVEDIPELAETSASVRIVSDNGVPLAVERSMFWDDTYYGGHTANAVAKPETRWVFAEGFQGFFDTYILIANANAETTTATLTFLRENDTPVVQSVEVGPFARKTVWAGDYPDVVGRAFGIVVEGSLPVIAERAMYFATLPNKLWTGGHVNTGIAAPSTSWFHAEGATGGFFSTFILLSNPQDTEAHVELRYLLDTGDVITRTRTIQPRQRLTINPAEEDDARLTDAALSTVVQSDVPIVSERSMYWPGDATPLGEGHNSAGVVSTALRWGLAEGRVGGARKFDTFILLANPSASAAEVTIAYLRESGAPIVRTYTVPATSRFNVDVKTVVPELLDSSFGARIEVTNGVPIAVERSLYWDANNMFWAGGTNALATPLP